MKWVNIQKNAITRHDIKEDIEEDFFKLCKYHYSTIIDNFYSCSIKRTTYLIN